MSSLRRERVLGFSHTHSCCSAGPLSAASQALMMNLQRIYHISCTCGKRWRILRLHETFLMFHSLSGVFFRALDVLRTFPSGFRVLCSPTSFLSGSRLFLQQERLVKGVSVLPLSFTFTSPSFQLFFTATEVWTSELNRMTWPEVPLHLHTFALICSFNPQFVPLQIIFNSNGLTQSLICRSLCAF